jgi:hypothetical protein
MNIRNISLAASIALAALAVCGPAYAQYWKVGADTNNVWSIADDNFVPSNDQTYLAWVAAGNRTTPIASTAELYDVIAQSYPRQLAGSAPSLDAYGGLTPLQSFTWRKDNGLNIVYTGTPSLNGLYAVDDIWRLYLMGGALIRCGVIPLESCPDPMPFGVATYTYLDKQLQPRTMSIVQMREITLALQNHLATLYAQLAVGLGGGTPTWPSLTKTVP